MLRVLTYNVHRCLGTDGRLSPERIAEVVTSCRADVVALQELDVGRVRTGSVDQAQLIARELNMDVHFHPAIRVMEELYGDAILTPLPSRLMKTGALPGVTRLSRLEPRGALWAAIDVGGVEVQVINTHLGLLGRERMAQVCELYGPAWLGHPACRDPVVLLGDFNAIPGSRAYRRLTAGLADAKRAPGMPRRLPTFPARFPVYRIDHVFVSRSLEVLDVATVRTPLSRVASDHLPLVVDLKLPPAPEGAAPAAG